MFCVKHNKQEVSMNYNYTVPRFDFSRLIHPAHMLFMLMTFCCLPFLYAVDADNDGLDDAWEFSMGLDPARTTRLIYLDAVSGDDMNSGSSQSSAKQTFSGAFAAMSQSAENAVLVASGIYSGSGNRSLAVSGKDVKLLFDGTGARPVVDLEDAGRFLSASYGTSFKASGLVFRNGRSDSRGTALDFSDSDVILVNCAFEDCRAGRRTSHTSGGYTYEYWTGNYMTAAVFAAVGTATLDGCRFSGNATFGSYSGWDEDYQRAESCGALMLVCLSNAVVRDCVFERNVGIGAGAAVSAGSDVSFTGCRFTGNRSSGTAGAVASSEIEWWDPGSEDYISGTGSLSMTNCLLSGNRAGARASDAWFSMPATLVNCTLAGGSCPTGKSIEIFGGATLLNCIVTGGIARSGGSFTVSACCCPDDLSSYGTGNIRTAPVLTAAGMLTAGSPCIDAGSPQGAPSADIDGTARPHGNAPDIGCQEFADTDGDGIPDAVEGANGLSANGDADSDGITDLAEYLQGTDPHAADTDGDGLSDGQELSLVYDPLAPTRFIYVDAADGDDNNSGLTAAAAVRTLGAAIAKSTSLHHENIVMVAPGTYSGAGNRDLDFRGCDIKLVSQSGAAATVVDLESAGRLLSLSSGETTASRLQGLTIRNGHSTTRGMAVSLRNASLSMQDCVVEDCLAGHRATGVSGGDIYEYWTDSYMTAAVYAENGTVRISGCRFAGNASMGDYTNARDMEETGSCGALILVMASGSVVEDCVFERNLGVEGGAAIVAGAEVSFVGCRFIGNRSVGIAGAVGGVAHVWYDDDEEEYQYSAGGVRMVNCLLRGNRAESSASDLDTEFGVAAALVNCTLHDGYSPDGVSCAFRGNTSLLNCIVTGDVAVAENTSFSASHCCHPADWSARGAGNIRTDPLLTAAGMLRAGSPCISAGASAGVPETDIDGTARPAASNPAIGCQEFADTDGDGIPDAVEGVSGLAADGDADNDGVANLEEYLRGTDPRLADTDGDGRPDGQELADGYSPLVFTRFAYVATDGDDANDGLDILRPKRTFADAVAKCCPIRLETVIVTAPGVYSPHGAALDFEGKDIRVESSGGPQCTTIDLKRSALGFVSLRRGETYACAVRGFTFTGVVEDHPAFLLDHARLTVRDCRFTGLKYTSTVLARNSFGEHVPGTVADVSHGGCRLAGVSVTGCSLAPYGILVKSVSSSLSLDSSLFEANETGGGPLLLLSESECAAVNTAFLRNNRKGEGHVALLRSGASLDLLNCTEAFNMDAAPVALSGNGALTAVNTILEGGASGLSASLSNCCTTPVLANAGTACIGMPPMLSPSGCLLPGSPCIDAGDAQAAPPLDRFGNARPAGDGVDIGCEEFADSDGDGISDYYEMMCGGMLAPDGDADSDGISNILEYTLGTRADLADSDGDGMEDGWERTYLLDPTRDDAWEDADGDGLANIEESAAGCSPRSADTDGDGYDDFWELREAFSDPSAADFNGSETTLVSVQGSMFTDSAGGWDADNGAACARGRAGWVEYSVTAPSAGIYALDVDVSQQAANPSVHSFTVACRVDGALCSTHEIPVVADSTATGRYMTQMLAAGAHTVRLTWSNVYRNTALRIHAVRLVSLSGPDTDGDGTPDWAETRLARMASVSLPANSLVSPAFMEGDNASFIEQILISGQYTPQGETPRPPDVKPISFNKWYADIPLNPDGATPVSVSVSCQNSAFTVSRSVAWAPLDVLSLEEITIRRGDSLLLSAALPVGEAATVSVTVGNATVSLAPGQRTPRLFDVAGEYAVTATWTGGDGLTRTNEGTVFVKTAAFKGNPACCAGHERTWVNPRIGADIWLEADRPPRIADLGMGYGGRKLTIYGSSSATGRVTARLEENGPVLDTAEVRVTEATTHVNDGYHRILAEYNDGTVLYDGYVTLGLVPPGATVRVNLWGGNSVFEDGTRTRTFGEEDFDASGELHFSILGGRSFTTCMSIYLYQDGELIWQLQ